MVTTATMPFDCGPDMRDRGTSAVDPCDANKTFEEPRVVIIGAGMAGLSAAARLTERGISNIVVLEAYERPGGRIHSCWFGDIVAELGSNWKPDNVLTNPIYTMSAMEHPPRPGAPGIEHPRGLFNRAIAGKIPFPPSISAYHKFRQIEQEAAQIYCLGGSKQHGSLINFMSLRIQQELHEFPEDQQHDAARIMFGLAHMLSAKCGDDTGMLAADNTGCFMNMPGGNVRVPLGLVGILAPFLRQLPEGSVRYCKPVDCIYWGTAQKAGHRALVCTHDGEEFPCDYVIVTVPLGVLYRDSSKMFCPALPCAKCDAMRALGFEYCNKIYMEFARPFWFWHKGNLNFKFPQGIYNRSDWTRGLTVLETVPNSKHVMCAKVVGPDAMVMEGLCEKDVAEGLIDVLRSCTNNPYIPYPVSILRSQWASNHFFQGSYSYDLCNCGGEAQRSMACPLPGPCDPKPPVLLFAGEATVPGHFATVSGARLSGVREAERIVQLTVKFKGPPLPSEKSIAKKKEKKLKKD